MSLKISEELLAFIIYEFPRMDTNSKNLEQDRRDYRKQKDIDRKKPQRQRDKELKALSIVRQYLSEKCYNHVVNEIEQSYENGLKILARNTRKEGDSKQNPLKSKSTSDLNNFLYACYRHISKENPQSKDMDIYKWIAEFLEQKEYRIKGKTVCDYDIIKERIHAYKTMHSDLKLSFDTLIDDSYQRFIVRNSPSK